MSVTTRISPKDRRDEAICDYVAGRLSPAKQALLACQASMNAELAQNLAFQESVSAVLMDEVEAQPLTSDFMDKVLAKLPKINDSSTKEVRPLPRSLTDFLKQEPEKIAWKTLIPGISVHDVLGDRSYGDDRLYMLKIIPGMGIWEHTHHGDEWVLVLKGAYEAEGQIHRAGDLHIEDDHTSHSLRALEGEDCICLVMTDSPIIMKSLLGKVLAKAIGL